MPVLTDQTRYRLLKLLWENPSYTQRELARELGISLGKINYCLNALISKGWVEVAASRGKSCKTASLYMLTPGGLEEKARSTLQFLNFKQNEHKALLAELDELRKEVALLVTVGKRE